MIGALRRLWGPQAEVLCITARWSMGSSGPQASATLQTMRIQDSDSALTWAVRTEISTSGVPVAIELAPDLVLVTGQAVAYGEAAVQMPAAPNLPATIIARSHGAQQHLPALSSAILCGDALLHNVPAPDGSGLGLPRYLMEALTEITTDENLLKSLTEEIHS